MLKKIGLLAILALHLAAVSHISALDIPLPPCFPCDAR